MGRGSQRHTNPASYFNLLPCSILEVLDKGKAAAVTSIVETKDKATGKVIFENQSTVFIRGAGGFGGKRSGQGTPQELRVCGSP